MRGRPRLLFFNQYYWPAVEATGQLLTQLAESLAEDYDVTVITGRTDHTKPGRSVRRGVEIVRIPSTRFDRRRLTLRGVNYLTYVTAAMGRGLAERPPDVVVSFTDPPFIGAAASVVARRFRAPLVVVSQDVFPEIAVAVGQIQNPVVIQAFERLVRFYLDRADRVVAIGETMRERLEAKGVDGGRLRVIPNWVDTSEIQPQAGRNGWAGEHGLDDQFVVMHSGNVGHVQDLDTLIGAATFLRDLDDLQIVIIGSGARHGELVSRAGQLEASQVRFLPYQPRERLSESLSAADVHVVGLTTGLAGLVVPSRLYGILAVGRPVIVAADPECETARLVHEIGCGVVVPPGRPKLLADAIRSAYSGELDLGEMGRRARDYAVAEGDRPVAVSRYRALLREVQGS